MRSIFIVMLASVLSILAFKAVDGSMRQGVPMASVDVEHKI